MTINDETLRLQAERLVTLGGFVDDTTRVLVRTWVATWDIIATDLQAGLEVAAAQLAAGQRLTWRQVNDVDRAAAALDSAAAALDDLAGAGRIQTTNSVGDVVSVAAQFSPQVLASQMPQGTQVAAAQLISGRMAGGAFDQIVERSIARIVSAMQPLSSEAQAAMRRELIRGVAQGTNPNVTARRMLSRLEAAFNGGLTRAVRIARTEQLDAYRAANGTVAAANRDVVSGWRWVAALDGRTCPACLAMHGTEFPADEFGPSGHPNCRCDRVDVAVPWRNLGFDIAEPADVLPDARSWFAGQPDEVQRQMLGPGRLGVLKSGRIGWDDMARRRSNDGWRDSVEVVPLQDLGVEVAA